MGDVCVKFCQRRAHKLGIECCSIFRSLFPITFAIEFHVVNLFSDFSNHDILSVYIYTRYILVSQ